MEDKTALIKGVEFPSILRGLETGTQSFNYYELEVAPSPSVGNLEYPASINYQSLIFHLDSDMIRGLPN